MRTLRSMNRVWPVLVVVATLSLSACGEGEGTQPTSAERPSSTAASPQTATTTRTPSTPAGDRRVARRAVLQPEDLPDGWARDPRDPPDAPAGRTSCPALEDAKATLTARGAAGGFLRASDGEGASQTVYLYRDTARAAEVLDALGAIESARCEGRGFEEDLRQGSGPGTTVEDAQTSLVKGPDVGDETTTFRVTLSVKDAGSTDDLDFDFVYTRSGRAVSLLVLTDAGPDARTAIAQAAAARMDAAVR